jgi:uncharacterized membrane protein YccC
MNRPTRQVGYFLSSQYFSDGLRTTLAILLPSLILAQFDHLTTGMAMSLGALSVSLSDAPGPVMHRRNGMLATVLSTVLVTLLTGFARLNDYTLAVEILVVSFVFSMLAVYGTRATSVGSGAILIMILMMERPLDAVGVVKESGLILAGGLWYTGISLLASRLQPYRLAQQTLGQCIHEVAKFLLVKAEFYTLSTQLDTDYRHLVSQQVAVSEKQDAVREVLFKSRRFVAETTRTGRLLVLTFVDIVDLYEQMVAMYYDYEALRKRFGHTTVLPMIAGQIRQLANELDHIGLAVQSPVAVPDRPDFDLTPQLETLKQAIDELGDREGSTLVLKKILINLRNLGQRISTIRGNMKAPASVLAKENDDLEFGRFVSHQEIDLKSIRNNLTFNSSVFRHALRLSLALLAGFVLTRLLDYGHHSYWVLLTISVILKPAFSLTRQRNFERIGGTLVGGIVGALILTFIDNRSVQIGFMILFMIGAYSAQRVNYIVMVLFLTPYILILFNFLGVNYLGVVEERFLDTLMGGLLSLVAGYVLFPRWESDQLQQPMRDTLRANLRYVQVLLDCLTSRTPSLVDYKLARKDVYVSSANLSAALDRMLSEPKRKQRNEKLIYEFVVLNHILSANVATLTSDLQNEPSKTYPPPVQRPVRRAIVSLTDSLYRLGEPRNGAGNDIPVMEIVQAPPPSDDMQLSEHLSFVQQVSSDINKVVERIKE